MWATNDDGKKHSEQIEMNFFTEAYEHATGMELTILYSIESPDFLCRKDNNDIVGVELTKVIIDYDCVYKVTDVTPEDEADPIRILDEAWSAIEIKDAKRKKLYGELKDKTILVLQLHDCPLESLMPFIHENTKSDYSSTGFIEIWLADYTRNEAYGDIELFGLHPEKYWGFSKRPGPDRKPFG
ncbi:MAG: hypothetical protein P9L92_10380 [Candidatus Electryonea clarkiae]|nr:hypothetical protein [Candidatus Electryonea clarkiae]MDP8288495.1 hypothetical protein [Candidatus Electryonea clarkiae]